MAISTNQECMGSKTGIGKITHLANHSSGVCIMGVTWSSTYQFSVPGGGSLASYLFVFSVFRYCFNAVVYPIDRHVSE